MAGRAVDSEPLWDYVDPVYGSRIILLNMNDMRSSSLPYHQLHRLPDAQLISYNCGKARVIRFLMRIKAKFSTVPLYKSKLFISRSYQILVLTIVLYHLRHSYAKNIVKNYQGPTTSWQVSPATSFFKF